LRWRLPACAQATLDERILEIREQSRFVPDKALEQLLKLQPELAAAPPTPAPNSSAR
jgi:hypothetical protein